LSADGKSIYTSGDERYAVGGGISQLVFAPQTRITESPPLWISARDATFRFRSGERGATFNCRLDSTSFEPCDSPRTYAALSSGEHTFAVRASADGTSDPTPARSVFNVDLNSPRTRITKGPHKSVHRRKAVLRFRADEASEFQCKLGGRHVRPRLRSWKPCGRASLATRGRQTYRHLRQGRKVFRVRATDRAGNVDPQPAKRAWRIR
jgi:hypothetical protein